MSRRVPMLALLAASMSSAPSWAQQTPPPLTFGTSVEAVYVDVFVTNGGQPVTGLTASAFELRDLGAVRPVELVAVETLPLTALLAFDTSSSVEGAKLAALRRASEAFLDGLRPEDEIGIVAFSHEVRWLARPTQNRDAVRRALAACRARGGTSLWDGLHAALGLLPPQVRSLVVIFTDGEDNMSWLDERQVKAAAQRSNAVIHAVGLRPEELPPQPAPFLRGSPVPSAASPVPQSPPELEQVRALRQTAEMTGGRFWTAESPDRLRQAFAAIVAAMNSRYVLRFEPAAGSAPGWHPIQLRLRGAKGDVRARAGYFRRSGS
ncbi:MAG TPA: VWA domain-containing protein [Vicinamibacteria bacterium]